MADLLGAMFGQSRRWRRGLKGLSRRAKRAQVAVAYAAAGEQYGIDAILDRTQIVRSQPRLRYVLG
jgi:hypothetical protein